MAPLSLGAAAAAMALATVALASTSRLDPGTADSCLLQWSEYEECMMRRLPGCVLPDCDLEGVHK